MFNRSICSRYQFTSVIIPLLTSNKFEYSTVIIIFFIEFYLYFVLSDVKLYPEGQHIREKPQYEELECAPDNYKLPQRKQPPVFPDTSKSKSILRQMGFENSNHSKSSKPKKAVQFPDTWSQSLADSSNSEWHDDTTTPPTGTCAFDDTTPLEVGKSILGSCFGPVCGESLVHGSQALKPEVHNLYFKVGTDQNCNLAHEFQLKVASTTSTIRPDSQLQIEDRHGIVVVESGKTTSETTAAAFPFAQSSTSGSLPIPIANGFHQPSYWNTTKKPSLADKAEFEKSFSQQLDKVVSFGVPASMNQVTNYFGNDDYNDDCNLSIHFPEKNNISPKSQYKAHLFKNIRSATVKGKT